MAKSQKRKRKNTNTTLKPFPGWAMGGFVFLLGLSGAWFGDMVSNHMFVKAIVAEIGICLLIFWRLYKSRSATSLTLRLNWPRGLAAALFLLASASVFWSVSRDFFVFKWLLWVAAAGAFLIGLNIKQDHKNLTQLAWGLISAGAIIALVGILQYLTPFDTPRSAAPPASTFGNRNMATHVIVLTLPFCFYLLALRSTRGLFNWMASIFGGLMLVYLFYTTTRAAWVSVLVSLLFGSGIYLWRRKAFASSIFWNKKKTMALLGSVILTLTMANFSSSGFKPFWRVLVPEVGSIASYANDSNNRRYGIYRAALEISKKRPLFGAGLGNYFYLKNVETNEQGKTYETYQTLGIQRVHNDFLELFIEIGIVGLLLFIAFGLSVLWSFFRLMKSPPETHTLFYLALGAALAGTMFNALFSFPYQVAVPMVLLGLYSALLIKRSDQVTPEPSKKTLALGRIKKLVLTAIFSYIGIFTIVVNLQWLQMFEEINARVVVAARSAEQRARDPNAMGWQTPLTFRGWFFHPEYQTMLKDTAKAYAVIGNYPAALNILRSVAEFWPNEYEVNLDQARAYAAIGKHTEAEAFMSKIFAMAPHGDYSGKLIQIAMATTRNDANKVLEYYTDLKNEAEDGLLVHPSTLQRLHTMAAELELADDAHRWYKLYQSKYPASAEMEANEAVVYISLDKNNRAALPHMQASIELNPDNKNNVQFKQIIKTLSEPTTESE